VVPGDHFGLDGYLRIGFGCDPEMLLGGLDRIGEVLDTLDPVPDTAAHAG
jgi:hypothetical protein